MIALLIAGIGFFVAGLVAIVFGVPVKEFSFGNTLILSGAVVACTGVILIGLSLVLRELKLIARRLGQSASVTSRSRADFPFPAAPATGDESPIVPPQHEESLPGPGAPPKPVATPVPWQEEGAARERSRSRPEPPSPEVAEPAAVPPAQKARRNLLFTSSRREKERLVAQSPDAATELPPLPSGSLPASDREMAPRPSFDEAWPQSDRARKEPGLRNSPSSGASSPAAARHDVPAHVTVLKSGVVDGMAYSLYSDGSIEAQMPEGMMRFASIEALRAHLDQRG